MRKPNFFIVGAPKCGTTALTNYLEEHPEIYFPKFGETLESSMGGKKELHFFGCDLDFNRNSVEEYLSYYSAAADQKHLGEASVFYLYSKRAAAEIYEFCPSAKIIIMLRNPVDMMYSWHSQLLFWGDEEIEDFELALALEDLRKNGQKVPKKADHPIDCFFYKDIARYTDQINRYLKIFGRDQVHIVIFDSFKRNTKESYQSVLKFLGEIDDTFEPNFKIVNSNKTIRNKKLQKFLKRPPQFSRNILKTVMPERARQNLREKVQNFNMKTEARKSLRPEFRDQLNHEFQSEVHRLSQLIGYDLTYWTAN